MKNLTRDSDRGFQLAHRARRNHAKLRRADPSSRRRAAVYVSPPVLSAPADPTLLPMKMPRLSAKLSRRAKIETIARARHWVHIDADDEFYQTVTGFLTAPDS